MTHKPTGIQAKAEESRKQSENKKMAFKRLTDKLIPLMKGAVAKKRVTSTERVRTYHQPDQRVTDHRVARKTWSYSRILNGDLDDLMEAISEELGE